MTCNKTNTKPVRPFLGLILAVLFGVCAGQGQLSWDALNSGTSVTLKGVDFINSDTGIVVGAQGLILRTMDGGASWETLDAGITTDLNAVCFVSASRIIAVGGSGKVVRSDDAGDNWEQIQTGSSVSMNGISIDRTNGKGLISGATLAVMWTNDYGTTWVGVSGGFMSDFNRAHMTEGDFGAAFGENSIFQPLIGHTDNGGTSFGMWYFYPLIGGTNYEGTAIDGYFFNKDDGFVVGRLWNGLGFITHNINWSSHQWLSQSLPFSLAAIDFEGTDHGVTVGGTVGNYIFLETFDGGNSWGTPVVNGNGTGFNDIVLVGQTGYAVGFNGQIVKKQTPVGTDPSRKETFRMAVSPNPAHDLAIVTILLDNPQGIALSICDLYGQTLRTFPVRELQAGRHIEMLNLVHLTSGIYMVKLISGDGFVAVKKMIVF